jgi:hypothetical protein
MAELDHIVIGAATLEQGADHVERLLGIRPLPGGVHEGAGTHNLLLGLGPECYLEVIAPDPDQPEPEGPRLFGLDDPGLWQQLEARPALLAWVARTSALDALVARLGPQRMSPVRAMSRGDLSWRIAEPPAGQDFDGLLPAMIEWKRQGAAGRLPDSGWRLVAVKGEHHDIDALVAALRERGLEDVLQPRFSPHARLLAMLRGADGREVVMSTD